MKAVRPSIFLVALLFAGTLARGDERWLEGTYRNPALGYSIKVPRGSKAKAGDEAGPERGVTISLPSGGTFVVYGEPDSLEWKNPTEGIHYDLEHEKCPSANSNESSARIGKLAGAQGTLVCGDRIVKVLLAFRSQGGLIYWFRLNTTPGHNAEDIAILRGIVATFRLIPWR
jgi:hypothetical protein